MCVLLIRDMFLLPIVVLHNPPKHDASIVCDGPYSDKNNVRDGAKHFPPVMEHKHFPPVMEQNTSRL